MADVLLSALFAGSIAGLVTSLLVPALMRLADTVGAVARPGGRYQHDRVVPRIGGVAIFLGIALGAGSLAVVQWGAFGFRASDLARSELLALGLSISLIFLLGLVDDLVGVSVSKKFLVQIAAASLLVSVGWSFQVVRLPFWGQVDLDGVGLLISVLWVVGVTNAINLLDGLDGLAGGVVAIIASSFLVYALIQGHLLTVLLMGAMVGACLGFLRHNWSPAKIFMGDSGSLTLGFILAAMTVHSSLKAPVAVAILIPVLALGLPVIDTLLVMMVRFLERPHSGPADRFLRMFHADSNHLHHVLHHLAPRRHTIVVVIYAMVLACCAASLMVAVTNNGALGYSLLVVEFLVILGVRSLGMGARARNLARWRKAQISSALELGRPAATGTAASPQEAPEGVYASDPHLVN